MNGETGSKTTDYLLKLEAVGLDSDPYDLIMNQGSMGIASWASDIYIYLISTLGKYTT